MLGIQLWKSDTWVLEMTNVEVCKEIYRGDDAGRWITGWGTKGCWLLVGAVKSKNEGTTGVRVR